MTVNTATPKATPTSASADELETHVRSFTTEAWNWVQDYWLSILIAAGAAVAIAALLYAIRAWAMKLCLRGNGVANWYAIIGRAVSRTSNFFIIMVSIRLVVGYAQTPPMVDTTVGFLFTIATVFQAAIWVRELVFGAIEHRTSAEDYHGQALTSALGIIRLLVTIVVFAIASVVVLSNLGVNVTGLVAGLGVGGIAIGLAAQGIFADLFAALAILFDKPFRVGHKVRFDQTSGVIQAIGLKSTRIRAYSGEEMVIANKQLLDKLLENHTHRDHVRIKLVIGVAYETPPEKLEALPEIVREIVEEAGVTLARGSYEAFSASSVDFVLEFDIPGDDWDTAHKARNRIIIGILRRFAAEGISIPYPTQTTFTADPDGKLIMPYPDQGFVLQSADGAPETGAARS